VNQINANSRQQFIIEEEGAYSQRSSEDEMNTQKRPKQGMPAQQVNNFNMNSQLNLSKKSSNTGNPTHKQSTFSYGHQGSQHSQNDPHATNKTNSRNGPRGESFNENNTGA